MDWLTPDAHARRGRHRRVGGNRARDRGRRSAASAGRSRSAPRRAEQLDETARLVADAGGRAVRALARRVRARVDRRVRRGGHRRSSARSTCSSTTRAPPSPGWLHEMSDEQHERIIATNLLGPILLTKRVVAALRERGAPGDIVFISSDATVHPRPFLGTYGVVEGRARGLRDDARARVRGLPDPVVDRAGRPDAHRVRRRRGTSRCSPRSFPHWQRFGIQRHFNTMQPEDVARAVVSRR